MSKLDNKVVRRNKLRMRIRKDIVGTAERPRLSVFRSNKEIYAQLVDDVNGTTLGAADSKAVKSGTKVEKSQAVGKSIAEVAKGLKIEKVVFDRGGYLYHGRVKSLAEGAREAGLQF